MNKNKTKINTTALVTTIVVVALLVYLGFRYPQAILPAIVFIIILAIIIIAHELGHFIAARRSGMGVEEFGFGYPPRLFSKKIGETIYSFNLLPLGGFVRILGEDGSSNSKNAFSSKPLKNRAVVIVAGVAMNLLLGYIAFIILFASGLPPMVSNFTDYNGVLLEGSGGVTIKGIAPGSLAEKYELQLGDTIIMVDGDESPTVFEIRDQIANNTNGVLRLTINRPMSAHYIVKDIELGESAALGVVLRENLQKVGYTWWKIPYYALIETSKMIWFMVIGILTILKNLIISHVVPDEVGGPVAIFGLTAVVVKMGWAYILAFFINLTVTLGIINILPFPALDGGRLVFLIVEKLRGKRVAQTVENVIHNIGFLILLVLIVLVTWRDIVRF